MNNVSTLNSTEEHFIHVMQLLGDKTRFKIFKLIASERNLCVSEIAEQLDISVSAVSQHFRTFEFIGLVQKERTGQKICYTLKKDDAFVDSLVKLTKQGVK